MSCLAPRLGVIVATVVAAGVLACGSGSGSRSSTPPDASPGDAGYDVGISTSPKPPLAGLVDMQDISFHDTASEPTFTMANADQFPGVLGGVVINATWDAMQPKQGGAVDFSTVDAALALVTAYNEAHPSAPLGTKLRIYQAANAPAWAKNIGGAPASIVRNPQGCPSGNCPLTIGRIWTAEYIAAWRAFLAEVAAKYDKNPLVRHVTVTSCAQQTDEPFVPTVDATSKANLADAGYTDALQKACLSGAVDDYADWKLTNVDYTFNAYVPTSGPADDTVFPETVMDGCRSKVGSRCVLGNHALSAPLRTADMGIYAAIGKLGAPVSFQTNGPQGMGCLWTQTIAQGVALHAGSIEVWPRASYGGFDGFTMAQMQQLASEFTTPIAVAPNPMPLPRGCTGFH